MRQVTYVNSDVVFRLNDDPSAYIMIQYSTGRLNNLTVGGTALGWTDENVMPDNNTWAIYRITFNGSSSAIAWNGNVVKTGTIGAQSTAYFQIANDATGANLEIKEIIIRSVVDNPTDNTSILNYLNSLYSVY
jgi:hypothetical protein